jgi:cellobiose-specific phosphotransferase system component IIC
MNLLFNSPYWILSASIIVVASIVFWCGALWLTRQKISIDALKKNHDVAGFTFSIVGILYSVILGFTVVSVQERYNRSIETIHTEATVLADLYREAGFFPESSRNQVRSTLRNYVSYVVSEEWHLPKDKKMHLGAQTILKELWDSYFQVILENDNQKAWYQESIGKLDDLMRARLEREFNSWDHLGSMMWSLLISGAIITILFMFFFGLDNLRSQLLMTALLAGYLSFILFLVFSLDHTFKGQENTTPIVMEQLSDLFDRWDM